MNISPVIADCDPILRKPSFCKFRRLCLELALISLWPELQTRTIQLEFKINNFIKKKKKEKPFVVA